MPHRTPTLHQFIMQKERQVPGATGEFTNLLHDIELASIFAAQATPEFASEP